MELTHPHLHRRVLPSVTGLCWVELRLHSITDAFLRSRVTPALVVQIYCGIVVWSFIMTSEA